MNIGGIIQGGLLAGMVINFGESILNAFLVADSWDGVAAVLGFEQSGSEELLLISTVWTLVETPLAVIAGAWLYTEVKAKVEEAAA